MVNLISFKIGLYLLMFVLFWVGVIRFLAAGADIVSDSIAVAVQLPKAAPSPERAATVASTGPRTFGKRR